LDARRGKSNAHLIVGIDQHVWKRAQQYIEPWEKWQPIGYSEIDSRLKAGNGFLPFDFGILTLIANQNGLNSVDLTKQLKIADLLKPEFKRNLILEDPRTSTPGLNFLLFTHHVFGQSSWEFWSRLKTQWLTLSPGWSSAYGLFLRNEAPLVWSYLTSQAFHEENESQGKFYPSRYKAVLFQEGQPIQIEGAAWVKDALKTPEHRKLAQAFLEFLISPEVQKEIPRKNWMMPVRRNVELPVSYKNLPRIINQFSLTSDAEKLRETLAQWHRAVH
jgi:thiamine transport system substrate-binding protein